MADIQKALELQSQGNIDEASKIYKEFLAENPEQPDVSNLLGLVFLQKNELVDAKKLFEIAIKGFPCAEFYQNLGLAYFKNKEYKIAMENFAKAVEFEKNNAKFIKNFARMAKTTSQTDYAIQFYELLLRIEPDDYLGWNSLGLMYEAKHNYQKAKESYIKSLKIKENYEAAHNLGVLYRTLRNFDESIKCLKQALKLKPNDNETMISLGMSYLSKKDLINGGKYYQFLKPEIKAKYKNHWDGKEHKDSILFVFYYAGYGDHIMFSRYLPFLKNYFKKIKVWLPPSVRILIKQNFDGIEFVDSDQVEYDYSANIMELHFLLDMDFDNIPFSDGYLKVSLEKIRNYKTNYFQTDKKKIGLFWQGNPKVFANRSILLKELDSLFELENTQFYAFEKEDEKNQIVDYPQIVDLGKTFKNFEDTAAALMNLDVLVTIDSAIAHLAGALGVKTFLLLPYSSEWRWFEDDKTTHWYNSIKIFKQITPWQWDKPVNDIFDEIKKI